LTAAINLAREGYEVTIFEKEDSVGRLGGCAPSVHMTPIDFKKMKDYIGIDVERCFSKLDSFDAKIYSKNVNFDPKYLYVTERGLNKTSIDNFLFKIAKKEGVKFEFSNPLEPSEIKNIPDNSIIAAGTYSGLCKYLKLCGKSFVHFDGYTTNKSDNNFCWAYFDSYVGGYGYAYIASKGNLISGEIDFSLKKSYEKYLEKFKKKLIENKNLEFDNWTLIEDYIPVNIHLFKKIHGKTFILAGAVSGFHDPFFGFGVNSALISGKIAALTVISKKRGLEEYNRFKKVLRKMFVISKFYDHMPLKNIIIPRLFNKKTNGLPIIGRDLLNIPGFTQKNCFNILNVE
jgi:flavin-dependent dehydrogenase